MINTLLFLLVASAVGTILWIILFCLRPVTKKLFSETWHYYASLIPVFFLFGGARIINLLVGFIRSHFQTVEEVMSSTITIGELMGFLQTGQIAPLLTEQPLSNLSYIEQIITSVIDCVREFAFLALIVWAAGAIIFIAVQTRRYHVYRKAILQDSRICKSVQCSVNVIISRYAPAPMLIGLWKPVIVLPDVHFNEKEFDMILLHELTHFKKNDLMFKLIVLIANALHWFNPVVYILNRQINLLCELSCDENIALEMDAQERKTYGETILSVLKHGVTQKNLICTAGLYNSKKNMKRRLLNMMNVKKTKKAMVVLSIAITMTIVSVGGIVASAANATLPLEGSQAEIDELNAQDEKNRVILEERLENIESVDVIVTERTQEEIDARNRRIQEEVTAGRAIDHGSMSQEEIDELRRNTPTYPPMTSEQVLERAKLYLERGLTMPEHYWNALVVAGLVSPDDNSNALALAQQEIHGIFEGE